jgi:predicted flavoprotein YhiN
VNDLKEINFKTMESKHENLYFAGIVNIDAITGGLISKCMDKWLLY